jgi:hypothetical protein
MAAVVMLLSVVLMYSMACTAAIQRTMRALDLFRCEAAEDSDGARA